MHNIPYDLIFDLQRVEVLLPDVEVEHVLARVKAPPDALYPHRHRVVELFPHFRVQRADEVPVARPGDEAPPPLLDPDGHLAQVLQVASRLHAPDPALKKIANILVRYL